jgi:hypothetical protein
MTVKTENDDEADAEREDEGEGEGEGEGEENPITWPLEKKSNTVQQQILIHAALLRRQQEKKGTPKHHVRAPCPYIDSPPASSLCRGGPGQQCPLPAPQESALLLPPGVGRAEVGQCVEHDMTCLDGRSSIATRKPSPEPPCAVVQSYGNCIVEGEGEGRLGGDVEWERRVQLVQERARRRLIGAGWCSVGLGTRCPGLAAMRRSVDRAALCGRWVGWSLRVFVCCRHGLGTSLVFVVQFATGALWMRGYLPRDLILLDLELVYCLFATCRHVQDAVDQLVALGMTHDNRGM